ncbi:MAG TPA: phosphoglycerate mutase family protein [Candidatus Udaeobacter sp.]|nr:phosphoglycerate mutase family protein [Candidatus Udaeobacter sp.]
MESARSQAAAGLDALRSFFVVRHAKAGDRDKWSGDDTLRPLTGKGRKQAEQLVALFQPFEVSSIHSSPYLRCVETVEPLAKARRLQVTKSRALEEGRGLTGLKGFLSDPALDNAVLCTHGDITFELVEELVANRVIKAGDGGYGKGSTWVLEVDDRGSPQRARYIPGP